MCTSPESLGIVVGIIYLTVAIMFQPFFQEKVIPSNVITI